MTRRKKCKIWGWILDFYLTRKKNNENFIDLYYASEFLMVIDFVNVSEYVTIN